MEINDYSYRTTDTINGKMIGHFTQVVWKASQKVGVGIAVGQRGDTFTVYIVARYSPSGNFNNIRSGESRGAARIRNYGNNVLRPNSKYSLFHKELPINILFHHHYISRIKYATDFWSLYYPVSPT